MRKMRIIGTLLLVAAFIATGWGMGITSAQAQTKTTLKYAHGARTDFSMHPASLEFKKVVEEATKGSLEITIYPNAALGPEREFIESLMMGNVDFGLTTNFTLSNLTGIPELLAFDVPWLIGDKDLYYRLYNESKAIKTIKAKLEAKGVKLLGGGDIGAFSILAKKPIRKPADIVGLKIRTGENPMVVDVFKTLGVRPVVVNFGELYTAFQQGVMDGLYTTTPLVHMTKTYEVAKELTQLNNAYTFALLVMNLKKFNSLPKDQQAAIVKAGDAYTVALRKASQEQDVRVIAAMEKTGVKFHSMTAKEQEPFKKAVEPVWKTWREKVNPEIFDEFQAFVKKNKK
ncbi:MAG: hypothetical protein CVU54_12745 [Deltaproteobacteria bacterium HGW-Deltaproteobacteria-12]|nr:MAG: hypothetical protein CVU54_12745 [Deltaproteobacteria bacterium HGW-Deltaproteobacteria-12]